MRVIIANFGRGNYLWPQCIERDTVATIEDVNLRPYFLSGDREGYIDLCVRTIKTARGKSPTPGVASRWFNIGLEIAQTNGDMWVHREKDEIWWTISKPDAAVAELQPAHLPSYPGQMTYVIHKPAQKWSNRDRRDKRLDWGSLHPRAKEFLFTESTLVRFSEDNAEYVEALVAGGDLSPWHKREIWRQKLEAAKHAPVTIFTPVQMAAFRMVQTALNTVAGANGQIVDKVMKNKEHHFGSEEEFRAYVEALIHDQEGLCALSGLPLEYDSIHQDKEMLASLDRIDSDGHYGPGNLQVVCRFVNRWKSNDSDENFSRLLAIVRRSAAG
jgi:hypothetical protein